MQTEQIGNLCQDVAQAAVEVRTLIGDRTPMGEVLNRFWLLHDTLNRVVQAVSDGSRDEDCRKVIRTVISGLESHQARKKQSVPAVRDVCDKINSLLMNLERLTAPQGAV